MADFLTACEAEEMSLAHIFCATAAKSMMWMKQLVWLVGDLIDRRVVADALGNATGSRSATVVQHEGAVK